MNDQGEGKVIAYAPCWSCGRPFTFDPDLVPSVPIDPATKRPPDVGEHGEPLPADKWTDPRNAVGQPVCEACVTLANADRKAAGRPLIDVLPGAYLSRP